MLNKRVQKLIAKGTALIITLTVMFGAAWAILSTEKVGLTVNVSFDPLVTAKVYLATNSSTAVDFKQPNATVTAENFAKANSALIVDTYEGTASQKALFEDLGSGESNGLKCDANGEMEFYVYVENYSTTESVYYSANINFVGTGEQIAPFSMVYNPNFEFAGIATPGGGSPFTSLLTFKIESTSQTGLNANAIEIEIVLQTSELLGFGRYTSGAYNGKYYIELGNAPQSYAGTSTAGDDFISATETSTQWVDNGFYYTNDSNPNIKYVLKNDKYYLVEPVRWIIIADENYPTVDGTLGVDYFSTTTLLAHDKTKLNNISTRQIVVISEKLLSEYAFTESYSTYSSCMDTLANKLFTSTELSLLNSVPLLTQRGSNPDSPSNKVALMGGDVSYTTENFYISNYLKTNPIRQACNTAYLSSDITNPITFNEYCLRSYTNYKAGNGSGHYISDTGALTYQTISSGSYASRGIRPMLIINSQL